MRKLTGSAAAVAAVLTLAGCVSTPMGPTVPVMPGHGKSQAAFEDDEYYCEHYANDRVAGKIDRANDKIARNTVLGTVLGAALGAAVGDTRGAIVGGAAGAAVGASTANPGQKQYSAQREYNIAYAQCMKYRGNDIAPPYGPPPPRWDRGYRDYPPPPPPDDDYPDDN